MSQQPGQLRLDMWLIRVMLVPAQPCAMTIPPTATADLVDAAAPRVPDGARRARAVAVRA